MIYSLKDDHVSKNRDRHLYRMISIGKNSLKTVSFDSTTNANFNCLKQNISVVTILLFKVSLPQVLWESLHIQDYLTRFSHRITSSACFPNRLLKRYFKINFVILCN